MDLAQDRHGVFSFESWPIFQCMAQARSCRTARKAEHRHDGGNGEQGDVSALAACSRASQRTIGPTKRNYSAVAGTRQKRKYSTARRCEEANPSPVLRIGWSHDARRVGAPFQGAMASSDLLDIRRELNALCSPHRGRPACSGEQKNGGQSTRKSGRGSRSCRAGGAVSWSVPGLARSRAAGAFRVRRGRWRRESHPASGFGPAGQLGSDQNAYGNRGR